MWRDPLDLLLVGVLEDTPISMSRFLVCRVPLMSQDHGICRFWAELFLIRPESSKECHLSLSGHWSDCRFVGLSGLVLFGSPLDWAFERLIKKCQVCSVMGFFILGLWTSSFEPYLHSGGYGGFPLISLNSSWLVLNFRHVREFSNTLTTSFSPYITSSCMSSSLGI